MTRLSLVFIDLAIDLLKDTAMVYVNLTQILYYVLAAWFSRAHRGSSFTSHFVEFLTARTVRELPMLFFLQRRLFISNLLLHSVNARKNFLLKMVEICNSSPLPARLLSASFLLSRWERRRGADADASEKRRRKEATRKFSSSSTLVAVHFLGIKAPPPPQGLADRRRRTQRVVWGQESKCQRVTEGSSVFLFSLQLHFLPPPKKKKLTKNVPLHPIRGLRRPRRPPRSDHCQPHAPGISGKRRERKWFFCKTNNVALCGKRQFAADVETILKDPLQETFVCEGLPYGWERNTHVVECLIQDQFCFW